MMAGRIRREWDVEALEVAAGWPGADRSTLVTLATGLAAGGADAEGYRFFQGLADASPGEPLRLALAGFFQARLGDEAAGLAKLDQAAAADLGLPQYWRGVALAGLAPDRGRAEQAVADLEFVLAVRDQFPPSLMRAVHCGLAAAYAVLGKDDLAAEASRKSGLGSLPPGSQLLYSSYWVTAEDGFRFTSPTIWQPAPGVQVAQGYDFGDFAFITTSDGVVAIDAGTTTERVQAALADLGIAAAAISHLILTHAHWDHVGGAAALRGPGTQVITQAGFPAELDRYRPRSAPPFGYFTGSGTRGGHDIVPDRLIAEPTGLTIGGTELVLYPTPGGETHDALLAYLPATGLLFTGDVMMPYLGAPFFAEGSPGGLLETLQFIGQLQPQALIQGHSVLTELFTIDAVPGLHAALTDLRRHVLDGIRHDLALPAILDTNALPEVLRNHPKAVVPYLTIRPYFAARLYHQHAGYWQPDLQGLQLFTAAERAAALNLLAGGSEQQFITTAQTLLSQGDHALALDIIDPALLAHPASTTLAALRQAALHRLIEQHQQNDPFKFLIYAELAGTQIRPLQ
jgi:glyoxylase-like metal-dependent hydrolase (beta-lactamase superfamily II)